MKNICTSIITYKSTYTGFVFDFEALCRLTDFYVDFYLNINRIIQLDGKTPQNLKYNLYDSFYWLLRRKTNLDNLITKLNINDSSRRS